MIVVTVNSERCKGCGLCISACPETIMNFTGQVNRSGQKIAGCTIPEKCVGCKFCGIICPDDAVVIEKI